MFYDSREIANNSVVEADLCIIGAGAAGITLARELQNQSLKVCLLESGGMDFDMDTQSLYQGKDVGYDAYPLDVSRMRFFGGTTNHWNGNIWPLFPDDFKKRDWIPDSGWPITHQALSDHYHRAAEIVEMKGPNTWDIDQLGAYVQGIFYDPRLLKSKVLDRAIFQHSPPTRFGQTYRQELERARDIHVYLWANASGFEADANGGRVKGVSVQCLNGRRFSVKAKAYVLSTGSIENARLLLVSNGQVKAGLGNQHDVVGRYFADHPMARIGKIIFTDAGDSLTAPGKSKGIRGLLTLQPEALQKHRIPRVMSILTPTSKITSKQAVRQFVNSSKQSWNSGEEFGDRMGDVAAALGHLRDDLSEIHGWADTKSAYLDVVLEQLPYRESRVTLDKESDALGIPKAVLDWRFHPDQEAVTRRAFQLMAEQIGAAGLGRMQITGDLSFGSRASFLFRSSFHQMGTTRMGTDPQTSVVDADARVHSVDNLYIAGSSIFPTTGVSNPTLSIVAMTLRLAAHLKEKLFV